MKLTNETESHFLLTHPDGHHVVVAKDKLSEKMLQKIQGMAEGGEVKLPKLDQDKVKDFQSGFNGQQQQQNPKLAQSQVKSYAEGTPPGGVPAPEKGSFAGTPLGQMWEAVKGNVAEGAQTNFSQAPAVQPLEQPAALASQAPVVSQPIEEEENFPLQQSAPQDPAVAAAPQAQAPAPAGKGIAAGFNDPMGMLYQGMELEQKGAQLQAKAEADLANKQADIYKTQLDAAAKFQAEKAAEEKTFWDEHQKVSDEYQKGKIDPRRIYSNMGVGNKIASGLAMILGGFGAGLAGGENPAVEMLNKLVEQDVASQEKNLGKTHSLLQANLERFKDKQVAKQATLSQMYAVLDGQIKEAAARAGDPMAKARLMAAQGEIINKKKDLLMMMNANKIVQQGTMGSGQGGSAAPLRGKAMQDSLRMSGRGDEADKWAAKYVPLLDQAGLSSYTATPEQAKILNEKLPAYQNYIGLLKETYELMNKSGVYKSWPLAKVHSTLEANAAMLRQDAQAIGNMGNQFSVGKDEFEKQLFDNPTSILSDSKAKPKFEAVLAHTLNKYKSLPNSFGVQAPPLPASRSITPKAAPANYKDLR